MTAQPTPAAGRIPNAGSCGSVPVHVIATNGQGTRAALIQAKRLAHQLSPRRVILLVPDSVRNISGHGVNTAEMSVQLAHECGLNVAVRLCLCGGSHHALQRLLPLGAIAIVGGRRRWWWPTREQRIAARLMRAGRRVIFADSAVSPSAT